MIRVTTNGVLRNYRSSLSRSSNNKNSAMEKVLTHRKFNSYAEDPSAATMAFQLRRSLWRTDSQIDNATSAQKKFESAYDLLGNISKTLDEIADDAALRSLTDSTASGRKPLGAKLIQDANSILQSMNTKYGNSFLFAGADGLNVPFALDANGEVTFRGVKVDSAPNSPGYAELQKMLGESTYVDIGLGMQEDGNGNIIPASAFNTSLSGLSFLGYGTDAEGLPNNVISIMQDLGKILSNCDDDGNWGNPGDQEMAIKLQKKLADGFSNFTGEYVEESTQADFLDTNLETLNLNRDNLAEQCLGIEQIDLADAITSFSWAQYCYNATLKVGNSILGESLMDYLN